MQGGGLLARSEKRGRAHPGGLGLGRDPDVEDTDRILLYLRLSFRKVHKFPWFHCLKFRHIKQVTNERHFLGLLWD